MSGNPEQLSAIGQGIDSIFDDSAGINLVHIPRDFLTGASSEYKHAKAALLVRPGQTETGFTVVVGMVRYYKLRPNAAVDTPTSLTHIEDHRQNVDIHRGVLHHNCHGLPCRCFSVRAWDNRPLVRVRGINTPEGQHNSVVPYLAGLLRYTFLRSDASDYDALSPDLKVDDPKLVWLRGMCSDGRRLFRNNLLTVVTRKLLLNKAA